MGFLTVRRSLLYPAIAVAALAREVPAQGVSEPGRRLLDSAPAELSQGDLQVALKGEARVLSLIDQPTSGVELEGRITLLITDRTGIPKGVHADRVWLRTGDSVAAGALGPPSQLVRIDQGPWRRTQQLSGHWPPWLNDADSVDFVVRVLRDSSQLGYLRISGQRIINLPRVARAKRSRYPSMVRVPGASYFGALFASGLTVMQGVYRSGQFERQAVALDAFSPGQPLNALHRSGKSLLLRYDTIPVGEYYGGEPWTYSVSRYDSVSSRWVSAHESSCLDTVNAVPVAQAFSPENVRRRQECFRPWLERTEAQGFSDVTLFWAGPATVRSVETIPVQLDSAIFNALERRGHDLWASALTELDPSERPTTVRIGVRRDERIVGTPGILVSWWQVILEHGGQWGADPRGSLFFIYSESERKILYATFGHPEWTPTSHLIRVRPYVYFRLDDSPTVYCLTEYGGAWESSGTAIFDIAAARPTVISH